MVYDLIRNDETMYKLFNWGIEGVQYVINDKAEPMIKKNRPCTGECEVGKNNALYTVRCPGPLLVFMH
jgi:hypothetical protein